MIARQIALGYNLAPNESSSGIPPQEGKDEKKKSPKLDTQSIHRHHAESLGPSKKKPAVGLETLLNINELEATKIPERLTAVLTEHDFGLRDLFEAPAAPLYNKEYEKLKAIMQSYIEVLHSDIPNTRKLAIVKATANLLMVTVTNPGNDTAEKIKILNSLIPGETLHPVIEIILARMQASKTINFLTEHGFIDED